MELTRNGTADLVDAYYHSWKGGIASLDATRLAAILAEDLDFEGPIAGKRRGAAGFIGGLSRFVEGLQAPIRVIQLVESGEGPAAALYDADLPEGSMRFAEFFEIGKGRIQSIRLVYDAAQYRALGGR
jgi:ketosteroid isomerase-like protein